MNSFGYRIVVLVACMVCFFGTISYAQSKDLNAITTAAEQGLPVYLGKIPPGMETRYGFASLEEIQKVTLGTPYQMHFVNIDETGVAKLEKLDEWKFPVIANHSYRALLTVAKVKGTWKAVEFGAAYLAKDLYAVEIRRGNHGDLKSKSFVRDYALNVDFVAYSDTDLIEDAEIIPLTSARKVLRLSAIPPKEKTDGLESEADIHLSYPEIIAVIRNGHNNLRR